MYIRKKMNLKNNQCSSVSTLNLKIIIIITQRSKLVGFRSTFENIECQVFSEVLGNSLHFLFIHE